MDLDGAGSENRATRSAGDDEPAAALRHPGDEWIEQRVRVWPAWDRARATMPMAEGVVYAYADGPTVLLRDDEGRDSAWLLSLPIDRLGKAPIPDAARPLSPEWRVEVRQHEADWIPRSPWLDDEGSAWNWADVDGGKLGADRVRVVRRLVSPPQVVTQ